MAQAARTEYDVAFQGTFGLRTASGSSFCFRNIGVSGGESLLASVTKCPEEVLYAGE